jgi:hypothetical protein
VSAEPTASASICTAHPPGASSASAHAAASTPASHATAPAACATPTAAPSTVATATVASTPSSASTHREGDAKIGATEWHMQLGQEWHDGQRQNRNHQPPCNRSHPFLLPIRITKSFQATLLHPGLLIADPVSATTLVGPISFERVRREAVA